MTKSLKGLSFSSYASLAGAVLVLADLIVFCIYGAVYPVYFDYGVVIFLVLGLAGAAGYALLDNAVSEWLNLVSVFCSTFALGVIFLNSYPVWADWYGGFTMYGSQGGIVPVVIVLALLLLGILAGIISCFTSKGGGKA